MAQAPCAKHRRQDVEFRGKPCKKWITREADIELTATHGVDHRRIGTKRTVWKDLHLDRAIGVGFDTIGKIQSRFLPAIGLRMRMAKPQLRRLCFGRRTDGKKRDGTSGKHATPIETLLPLIVHCILPHCNPQALAP
jgi:hypothetical protein